MKQRHPDEIMDKYRMLLLYSDRQQLSVTTTMGRNNQELIEIFFNHTQIKNKE